MLVACSAYVVLRVVVLCYAFCNALFVLMFDMFWASPAHIKGVLFYFNTWHHTMGP